MTNRPLYSNVLRSHKFVLLNDDENQDISQGKSKEELSSAPTWLIDPMDGTINFVHRFPFIAVSIAFAVEKKVQVGVVFNPILNEMYTGQFSEIFL